VVVEAAALDDDVARTGLHEPARQQAAHAERARAVARLHRVGLGGHFEGRARLGRFDQRVGELVVLLERVQRIRFAERRETRIEPPPQFLAAHAARFVDVLRRGEVAHAVTGRGRIAAHGERCERRAQVAGAEEAVGRRRHAHVRWQRVAHAELLAHHRAEARIDEGRTRLVAGEHRVLAAVVIRFGVRHRAHDRQLVGERGGLAQQFAERLAVELGRDRAERTAHLDRRIGLGVERVDVAHATAEVDLDHRIGARRHTPRRLQRAQRRGETEAAHAETSGGRTPQELAAVRMVHDRLRGGRTRC
jgi:hypothetical protein